MPGGHFAPRWPSDLKGDEPMPLRIIDTISKSAPCLHASVSTHTSIFTGPRLALA